MNLSSFQIASTYMVVLFFVLSFSACEKDDTTTPMVQLLSIQGDDIFASNESIPIEVNISDNKTLISYKVLIRNLVSDELEFIISETTDQSSIDINDVFSTEVAQETAFDVEMTAEDDSGNMTFRKTRFTVLPPEGGMLALNFKLQYQDNPLLMFERYNYVDDIQLYFTRFSFYLSHIILIGTDGSETEIKEVDFVNLTADHENPTSATAGTTYTIPAIPEGDYAAIKFAVGVPEDLNAKKPAEYMVGHPLSKTGEYWESWNSFIFAKTEGFIDTLGTGNFDLGMALHTGSDNVYREKTVETSISISNNMTTTLSFDIDLYDMLVQDNETYDLTQNSQIHSLSQVSLAEQLADNLIQIIK